MTENQETRNQSQDDIPMNEALRKSLLNFFRCDDYRRESLTHNIPVHWQDTDWVCTTNGSALVLIRDQGDIQVERSKKTPDVAGILPKEVIPHPIQVSQLQELINSIPKITRFQREECEACEGRGKFEHFGHDYDCESCDEKGYVELGSKETIPDPDYYLEIDGKLLNHERIHELSTVILRLNPQQLILLRNEEKPTLVLFRVNHEVVIGLAKTYLEYCKKKVTYDLDRKEESND